MPPVTKAIAAQTLPTRPPACCSDAGRRPANPDRDHHVREADFFDVENFPTATFTSTGLREDNDKYSLDGEFCLRGVTKPITLRLEYFGVSPGMGKGEVAGFEATVALSRKEFGILTDTPIIGGGALLGDTVDITIEVEALKTT